MAKAKGVLGDVTNYLNKTVNAQIRANNEGYNAWVTAQEGANNDYIASMQEQTDLANKQATENTEQSIIGTRQQYQKAYDYNAINQQVQQDQVAERMADIGLSKSGLNLTQQTAFGVARINSDNAVTQSYNNAVNTLRTNLQNIIQENNKALNQTKADVKYNFAQEDANRRAEIAQENADLTASAKTDAYSLREEMFSTIASNKGNDSANAQNIYNYATTYGLSEGSIKRLCNKAGIDYNEYKKWVRNPNYFGNQVEGAEFREFRSGLVSYNDGTASGKASGCKQILSYVIKNPKITDKQLERLCKDVGISVADYKKWKKNRSFFKEQEETKKSSATGSKKEGDKTGGKQPTGNPNPKKNGVKTQSYTNALKTLNLHYRSPDHTKMTAKSVQTYIDKLAKTYNLSDDAKEMLEDVITDRYDIHE